MDLHYKVDADIDHVAKFSGDPVAKKHHEQNIRPSGTTVPGGLINN